MHPAELAAHWATATNSITFHIRMRAVKPSASNRMLVVTRKGDGNQARKMDVDTGCCVAMWRSRAAVSRSDTWTMHEQVSQGSSKGLHPHA